MAGLSRSVTFGSLTMATLALGAWVVETAVPASAQGIAGSWPQGGQGIVGSWPRSGAWETFRASGRSRSAKAERTGAWSCGVGVVQDERAQAFNCEIVLRETRHGRVLNLTAKPRVCFRRPDMVFPRRALSIAQAYRWRRRAPASDLRHAIPDRDPVSRGVTER
jgi:hypothetical protein